MLKLTTFTLPWTPTILLLLLLFIFNLIIYVDGQCSRISNGGYLGEDVVVSPYDNPCYVKNDLFVPEKVKLTFEAGTEVRFGPGVMLAVNGTLIAKGEPNRRILLTKSNHSDSQPKWPTAIRLVDEFSVSYGRLQLLYKKRWRGVCANNVNWTQADTDVACRQLGFHSGNFSFGTWARNDSYYLLYFKPNCHGNESSVSKCPNRQNVKIGTNICKNQHSIYLNCSGLRENDPVSDNWWGLEFYNTTYTQRRDGNVQTNESTSILENLDIYFAGVDKTLNRVPALRADPTAPNLINVNIFHSALDAVNFTNIISSTILHHTTINNSRGHGINVESLLGRVSITDSHFIGNQGNGVKVKFLDRRFQIVDKDLLFCNQPNTRQRFPQIITGIPGFENSCSRRFNTTYNKRITLNVLEMDIEPDAGGSLEIFDGYDQRAQKIGHYNIVNGSFPMGVTSTYYYMFVKFSWKLPPKRRCPSLPFCVKFTIIIDTHTESLPEFYMNNTIISDNGQHGLYVENVRNYVMINSSEITRSNYGAGIRVFGGAGDLLINASKVERNQDSGVNITYDGGWRIFNRTSFSYNFGPAINITFNETSVDNFTRYTRIQKTHVSRSVFVANKGYGIQVGNYCLAGHAVVVNDSYFSLNSFTAVQAFSCFRQIPFNNVTNFTIAYNKFDRNREHAIRISPLINAVGRISNNTFANHPKYVLLLDNTEDFLHNQFFLPLKTLYEVWGNLFHDNRGHYVANLRLTQGAPFQSISVMYNYFVNNNLNNFNQTTDMNFLDADNRNNFDLNKYDFFNDIFNINNVNINHMVNQLGNYSEELPDWMKVSSNYEYSHNETLIQRPDSVLNERSRVKAVIIFSSSNIVLKRNHLQNPNSNYELATQLDEMNIILDASEQWWSTKEYTHIISKIFDQYSRYNLARIKYHPALEQSWLYTHVTTNRSIPIEINFLRGNRIGGRLAVRKTLEPFVTYHVDRDLSILVGGSLLLGQGTRLQFENCLSMSVEGAVRWTGTKQNPIVFESLDNETTWINSSFIRLEGGVLEGRLLVRPDVDQPWGSVCREGWSMMNSIVACKQMGLVADLADWRHLKDYHETNLNEPIYRSYVQCNEFDDEILACEADHIDDHSCDHLQDVYLKCKLPSWGGIHFLATTFPSEIENVVMRGAGLDDPLSSSTVPALMIDYNLHNLNQLTIEDNRGDGLFIYHNDVTDNFKLRNSIVRRNGGTGITVKSSFFEVFNCLVEDNEVSGLKYDPQMTTPEALLFRTGVTRKDQLFVINKNDSITINTREDLRWILTERNSYKLPMMFEIEITAMNFYKVHLDLIDYNPIRDEEVVEVYNGPRNSIKSTTSFYTLPKDVIEFPLVSQFQSLTIRWFVTNTSSGRLTFVARSREFQRDEPWPFPILMLKDSVFRGNKKGVITNQYNQPFNEYYDLFMRYKWTKMYFYNVTFENNIYEPVYAASISRYNLLYVPDYTVLEETNDVAELNYQFVECNFRGNGLGVKSEHLNVEYSSNVWVWEIQNTLFENNKRGGLAIYLPRVNLIDVDLYNHSFTANGSTFRNNENFQFRLDGFYCNSTVSNNLFENNKCKPGCFIFTGTEKDFEIVDNQFVSNQVHRYVVELNMNSHTAFTQWVDSIVTYNVIQRNIRLNKNKRGSISSPLTYAVGMFGVQNVTVIRNLLGNGDLDVELIAGQLPSELENYLDATYNYWGTSDEATIRKRIFDFDDWNCFSIAEFYPFLLSSYFGSSAYMGPRSIPIIDLSQPLGGRISEDLYLPKRKQPYLVKSDLTIMPGAKVVVEAGVRMLFYPNIGILSLGSLSMMGNYYEKIFLGPVNHDSNDSSSNWYTHTESQAIKILHPDVDNEKGYQIKLSSGKEGVHTEGFVEIYNTTEKKWSLVCDDAFNDRTAEVLCRTMGFESSNAIVVRSPFYDIFILGYPKMHEQLIEWYWRETFFCDGREDSLEECRRRINYALPECMVTRRYVYVRCGERNLPNNMEYWGSIRINIPSLESGKMSTEFVRMQWVEMYGAGHLHNRKSAALEGIFRSPDVQHIIIQNSLYNGVEFVAPIDRFSIKHSVIQNNNGYAIGVVNLNGQSTEEVESNFVPLVENRVPYDALGFIRMCTVEKMLYVRDRSLIYYKYDYNVVDCIKILRSKIPRKRIAIRFLQVNLFNESQYENSIEIYNSEFVEENLLVGKINSNSTLKDIKKIYISDDMFDTLTIRIKGSAGYLQYGFVAEVLTVPISGLWRPDFGVNKIQLVNNNLLSQNEGGGFFFHNVGENNMRLSFESNHVTKCGLKILNLTMPGSVDIFIQNTKLLTFANNYIDHNAGGVSVNTTTRDIQVAIYANVTNNVITHNTHGHALHIQGHRYQGFDVRYNYLAFNDVDHRNIFSAFGVQLNFTYNVIYNNSGQCIINASVEELVSVTQMYKRNYIYDNWSNSFNRSTFFLKSAQFSITENFLLNPYNFFEVTMFNRTKYLNDELEIYPKVYARNNWWGSGESTYPAGRIWDRSDDDNLIQVDYLPCYPDNTTLLEGKCYPGWKQKEKKCYWYFGGVAPYHVADKICRRNRARLAWARESTGRETSLGDVVSMFQYNYNVDWQTWVFSDKLSDSHSCASLQNYVVKPLPCETLLPFLCEKTPFIEPRMDPLPVILAAVISACILLFVILPLCCLGSIKSFQRKEEKHERKEILRQSFRLTRSITPVTIQAAKSNEEDTSPPFTITENQYLNIVGGSFGDTSSDFKSKLSLSSIASSLKFKRGSSNKYDQKFTDMSFIDTDSSESIIKPRNRISSGRIENEITVASPLKSIQEDILYKQNMPEGAFNQGYRQNSEESYRNAHSIKRPALNPQKKFFNPFNNPQLSSPQSPKNFLDDPRNMQLNTTKQTYNPFSSNVRERPPLQQKSEQVQPFLLQQGYQNYDEMHGGAEQGEIQTSSSQKNTSLKKRKAKNSEEQNIEQQNRRGTKPITVKNVSLEGTFV